MKGVRTDDGVILHVTTGGMPASPVTVLFCHGFAARGEEFDDQWRAGHRTPAGASKSKGRPLP